MEINQYFSLIWNEFESNQKRTPSNQCFTFEIIYKRLADLSAIISHLLCICQGSNLHWKCQKMTINCAQKCWNSLKVLNYGSPIPLSISWNFNADSPLGVSVYSMISRSSCVCLSKINRSIFAKQFSSQILQNVLCFSFKKYVRNGCYIRLSECVLCVSGDKLSKTIISTAKWI